MGRTPGALGVVIMALALVLAACGGAADATPTATTEPSTGGATLPPLKTGRDVTAPDARYSLRVPADWVAANAPVAELSYRSPQPDPRQALSFTMVREELADISRAQVYAEAGRRRISGLYRNVITLSMAPVRVGRVEAQRWIYTADTGTGEFYIYQLYVVDGGEGFVFTGLAPLTNDFAEAQATFDGIAGSLILARG